MTNANESIHALDQLRQRLSQMSTSIASLKADLERPEPLPSWSSLQSSAQILSHNLGQLMATIDANRDLFSASHAYPLPSFPGHTREALLNQLLRKRLEPRTEDWLKQHSTTPTPTNGSMTQADSSTRRALDAQQLRQLWDFAGPKSNSIVKELLEIGSFEDDFTIAEQEQGIDTVVTGLRRDHVRDESDAGSDDQEMKDADVNRETETEGVAQIPEAPSMPLESILRVMSVGRVS